MNVERYVAVWQWPDGVRFHLGHGTAAARRDSMVRTMAGGYRSAHRVETSDGSMRRLHETTEVLSVDLIARRPKQ